MSTSSILGRRKGMRKLVIMAAVIALVVTSFAQARSMPHPREIKAGTHFGLLCHE